MEGISSLHRRDVIKGVRKRWEDQYSHCEPTYKIGPRDKEEPVGVIRTRLRNLNLDTCSVADVDRAIGTDGWAANECEVCGDDAPITVALTSRFSEDRTVSVCKSCLQAALKLTSEKPRL